MKEFEFREDMSIEELLNELNSMEGVEAKIEFINETDNIDNKIITTKDIRTEIERIMILIEEQKEYEVAMEKLKELYQLFDDIEWGKYELEIDWD